MTPTPEHGSSNRVNALDKDRWCSLTSPQDEGSNPSASTIFFGAWGDQGLPGWAMP